MVFGSAELFLFVKAIWHVGAYRVYQVYDMFSRHLLQYFKCGTKPVTPSSASKSFPDKSIMDVSVEGGEGGGEVGGGEGGGKGEGVGGEEGEGEREGGEAGREEGTGGCEKEQDVRKNGAGLKVVREGGGEGVTVEDKEGDKDGNMEKIETRKRRRDEVRLIMYSYRLLIMYFKCSVFTYTCRTLLKIVIAMWRKLSRQFHHPKSQGEMTLRQIKMKLNLWM